VRLLIAEDVRKAFPELRIAVLRATGIDNTGSDPGLDAEKRDAARCLTAEHTNESLSLLPEIGAWRTAYRAFGIKPRDHRPTAEAFLRRLVKGEEFPTISKAVDAYLLVETRFFLPVGGYDLAAVTGDVELRHSPGDEEFTPIGARDPEHTRPGEIVYADAARVLTRKWNYRDCDACRVTPESTEIALFTEAPYGEVTTQRLADSIAATAGAVSRYCGGTVITHLLDCSVAGELEF
jgi:DNA/RNA-binding domain of Phe-tRNA-synthetase-like protein